MGRNGEHTVRNGVWVETENSGEKRGCRSDSERRGLVAECSECTECTECPENAIEW